jgi:hypothetical protein
MPQHDFAVNHVSGATEADEMNFHRRKRYSN